jgi:hypothetical protein
LTAYPAFRFGGLEGLQSMLLGAALSWLTIVASYFALSLAFRNTPQFAVIVVIGGFLVRLGALFGLLRLISKTMPIDLAHLVLWTVSFYLVLVTAEAYTLAAEVRQPEA